MEKELNRKVDFKEVSNTMRDAFQNVFGLKWVEP
jgi:hypothetical protein